MGAPEDFDRTFGNIGQEASKKLEGYFPGLSEKVDELVYRRYGKGIRINRDERDPQSQSRIVGCILPLDSNQNKHLIILKSGTILVTEPATDVYEELYRKKYSLSTMDYEFDPIDTLNSVEHNIATGGSHFSKVILNNQNLDQADQIKQAVIDAVNLARVEKEKRDRAKEETARDAIAKIDQFLNPKPDSPPLDLT